MVSQDLSIVMQPQEFFKEQVDEARGKLKLELDEEVEFYVVNLLCEFVFSPALDVSEESDCAFNYPLALVLKKALESPPERRSGIFKKMGDTSLYVAGYFQDYFNRKTFDIDYYITMGRNAFGNLSELMKHHHADPHFASIYGEIANRFSDLVELLATISESSANENSDNLLALYDRWNQTRSERLRRILESHGIEAIPVTKKAQ